MYDSFVSYFDVFFSFYSHYDFKNLAKSCKAMSIGSRSQSARTYLEKVLDEIDDCSRNDLVKHGLTALRETLPADHVRIEPFYQMNKIIIIIIDIKFLRN